MEVIICTIYIKDKMYPAANHKKNIMMMQLHVSKVALPMVAPFKIIQIKL